MARAAALTVSLLALSVLGGFGATTADASTTSGQKIAQANRQMHRSKTALRWITTHMRLYRNSRIYHSVISTWRTNLFYWRRKLAELARSLGPGRPPHYSSWLCIHRFEGAWDDHGAPYYGGLQMDWDFMRSYGGGLLARKGTADHWTPLEQMWAAERAYRSGRGFTPWPNTARMCGLL